MNPKPSRVALWIALVLAVAHVAVAVQISRVLVFEAPALIHQYREYSMRLPFLTEKIFLLGGQPEFILVLLSSLLLLDVVVMGVLAGYRLKWWVLGWGAFFFLLLLSYLVALEIGLYLAQTKIIEALNR